MFIFFLVKYVDVTCTLGFGRKEKCGGSPNIVRYTGEKIKKSHFLGSWEGLKRENLVQILHFSQAIMSQKSQF